MQAMRCCLPLLFLSLVSCTRKLPGPVECRAYAEAASGLSRARYAYQADAAAMRAEQLTVDCLTTPWDRQLLQCLNAGNSGRACRAAFVARRADSATAIQLIR